MKASELKTLIYSPIWTSKILHYFLSGAMDVNEQGLKFELLYFALPFIFDEIVNLKLVRSKKSSTLTTVFDSNELKKQLIDKDEQIDRFREITNEGFIYLSTNEKVAVGEYITIKNIINYKQENHLYLKQKYKASYNWGYILAKEDYLTIFLKIGVTKI